VIGLDRRPSRAKAERREVRISPLELTGILQIQEQAFALVAFAHGSGSSRFSPRNMLVADALNDWGIATPLFDLLTLVEETNRANVFNISLLAERLIDAVSWADGREVVAKVPLGLFGASTGAAALVAAAKFSRRVGAVVSRGGRPDLAGDLCTVLSLRHFRLARWCSLSLGEGSPKTSPKTRARRIKGNKTIADQPPLLNLSTKSHDSNERLRVGNWIVQRLDYYAVKETVEFRLLVRAHIHAPSQWGGKLLISLDLGGAAGQD